MHLSVAILRVPHGLDYTGLIGEVNFVAPSSTNATSPVTEAQPTAAVTDDIKPSASSASGWPEGKSLSRSRESLHSHGLCFFNSKFFFSTQKVFFS